MAAHPLDELARDPAATLRMVAHERKNPHVYPHVGRLKAAIGKAVGNRSLEAESKDEHVGGKTQEKLVHVKKLIGK
jgi:uncharacterized protein YjbJ (UPF0337 family)